MEREEQAYFQRIDETVERFGTVQRDFILQKNGVASLVRFIGHMEGRNLELSLKDPVMVKARKAAETVVEEMRSILNLIGGIEPPEVWTPFHRTMAESLERQIEGYREMLRAFDDNDVRHIGRGQDMVKKGLSLLGGGAHVIQP